MTAPGAVKKGLAAELPCKVNAPTLAAAALRRSCDLGEQYAADFPDRLTAMKKGGKKRKVSNWIKDAEANAGIPLASAADVYIAMVFVSPVFAKEFAGERPQSFAFEHLCAAFTDRLGHGAKASWDQGAATAPTARDRIRLPVMARVLEVGQAEFSLLAEARTYLQPKFEANPTANASYRRFHIPVRRAFEDWHGRILEEYWCVEVPVGAVRTAGGSSGIQVHFDGDYDECLIDLFNRCKEVNRKGHEFLPPAEYETPGRESLRPTYRPALDGR